MAIDPEQQNLLNKLYWSRERNQCANDLDYFATKYLKVKGRETVGLLPLRWRRVQSYVHESIKKMHRETGFVRLIIEKARQQGISTMLRALIYQQLALRGHRNAVLVANDEPTTKTVFNKDHVFHDTIAPPLRQPLSHDSTTEMQFAVNKSRSLAQHAKDKNVGAGDTIHALQLTEVARFGKDIDQVESSLLPALSEAKGDDFSICIYEGTAVLGGEAFKNKFEAAVRGETEYRALFLPWFWHEPYQRPVPPGFKPDPEERELMRRFELTLEQIVWRRYKIETDYLENPMLFQQDYPCTHEEAWVLPKGANRIFKEEDLMAVTRHARAAEQYTVGSTGLRQQHGGMIDVWEPPASGKYYHIGIDIAEGATETADWTVLHIMRRDTLTQVAEVRVHMNPGDEDFPRLVYHLGKAYNNAQLIPDVTGGWGNYLIAELKRLHYHHIWQMTPPSSATDRQSPRVGYLYQKESKRLLVATAVAAVKRGDVRLMSETLRTEMRTFINFGVDEWGGKPGTYDDCVNAFMLALIGTIGERGSYDQPTIVKPAEERIDPCFQHNIDEELKAYYDERYATARSWDV